MKSTLIFLSLAFSLSAADMRCPRYYEPYPAIDFPGNDISCGQYSTVQQAANACKYNSQCKGFSIRTDGKPWCLKHYLSSLVNDNTHYFCKPMADYSVHCGTLYQHYNGAGMAKAISRNSNSLSWQYQNDGTDQASWTGSLTGSWNDIVSSVEVFEGCKMEMNKHGSTSSKFAFINNKYSGYWNGQQYWPYIWQHEGSYTSGSVDTHYPGGVWNLPTNTESNTYPSFNDIMSSFKCSCRWQNMPNWSPGGPPGRRAEAGSSGASSAAETTAQRLHRAEEQQRAQPTAPVAPPPSSSNHTDLARVRFDDATHLWTTDPEPVVATRASGAV